MTGIIDPARFGMPDATTAGVPAGTTLHRLYGTDDDHHTWDGD